MHCNPPGSSLHEDSPGKSIGVLLQGILPAQWLNPSLLHCRQSLYHLSHPGSPRILEWDPNPSSENIHNSGIKPGSPALQAYYKLGYEGSPLYIVFGLKCFFWYCKWKSLRDAELGVGGEALIVRLSSTSCKCSDLSLFLFSSSWMPCFCAPQSTIVNPRICRLHLEDEQWWREPLICHVVASLWEGFEPLMRSLGANPGKWRYQKKS